jgi:hypothetical protein
MQGSPREVHAHLSVRRISLLFLDESTEPEVRVRQRSNSPVVFALASTSHHRMFSTDFYQVFWW